MTLSRLTEIETVYVYPLVWTEDAAMHEVESLGSLAATWTCRAQYLTGEQRNEFGLLGEVQGAKFVFSEDPSITTEDVIVWDSLVWRVRSTGNTIGRLWTVIGEQMPQIELSAP